MDKKIGIFEDVTKDIINKFFKKEYLKKEYFSFFFDEEENDNNILVSETKKYYNFDDIPLEIFDKIQDMMIAEHDFSIDIIKKYILIVKNIENYDIDIISLVFKSIELQYEIIKYKNTNYSFETTSHLEKFILDNLYFNMQNYIDFLGRFYTNNKYKPALTNIFVMIYNYSLFYSIESLKKILLIKN